MKQLIILRGIPASGKSTFVKEHNLESYTVSLDSIRKLLNCYTMTLTGWTIDQSRTGEAAELLHKIVEGRMKNGELVLVDGTHLKTKDITVYNGLCKTYGYRKLIVDFEISKEEAILRDSKRGPEMVGKKVIERMFERRSQQELPENWPLIKAEDFNEQLVWRASNLRDYLSVNVFGDIHGCVKPLRQFFMKYPFSENEFYIFTGDYLDRGTDNEKVLNWIMTLSETKDNVVFLEGNHERWLRDYVNGIEAKSKEFADRTAKQIESIDRKRISKFVKKLNQCFLFDFRGVRYFVNHGGLPFYEKELIRIPTSQIIKGVGGYGDDIDSIWASNEKKIVQIHGHRNTFGTDGNEMSINLEGGVENGGCLKVWRSGKIIKIENAISSDDFRNSNLVNKKELANNIESFNFTREAFTNSEWNNLTVKARGLFMRDGKVVARSYDKFFNIDEVEETKWNNLLKREGEITCYEKSNGFLGILSYIDGSLHFFSKSTDAGDYANYFKTIFYKTVENIEEVENLLKDGKHSMVFEVIDTVNDPHIVEYKEDKVVLLDMIENDLNFKKVSFDELQEISLKIGCPVKKIKKKFNSFSDMKEWFENSSDSDFVNEEGIVAEQVTPNGVFMCKAKFNWYKHWKHMRSLKDKLEKGYKINEHNDFTDWLENNIELVNKDIISLRNLYEKS